MDLKHKTILDVQRKLALTGLEGGSRAHRLQTHRRFKAYAKLRKYHEDMAEKLRHLAQRELDRNKDLRPYY